MSTSKLLIASAAFALLIGGRASSAQPTKPMPTRDFVQAAQASDAYEIEAAQDAITQSHDPQVQAFAQQMIRDHTRTSQTLRQAVLASGMTPPPIALNDDGEKMLSALQSLREPDFDRAYWRQQALAHQSALAVEQDYVSTGADFNIRRAAQSAVPIIQQHLQMAQRMQAAP